MYFNDVCELKKGKQHYMAVLQRDELTVRHLPHKLSALTERSNRDLSSLDLIKADLHKPCESAKESDAKRGVQGNDLFIVLKAEILGRKFYGICRMMDVHVHGKALGARVIRALDLDGKTIFAPVAGIRTALRFPIIGGISVDGELHLYIVFGHAAFEIVQLIDHVENIVCVQILLGAEQAQIGYIDFESVDISIVFQRLFDLFDAIDLGNDAGQTKPFDGIFKFGCASAFLDEFVLEARILLGELHSDVVVGEPRFLDYLFLQAYLYRLLNHSVIADSVVYQLNVHLFQKKYV